MADSRPVGVFDSGVGGVSFLREALKENPQENFIYYGDNAHTPYGLKTPDQIVEWSVEGARFLQKKGCKMLVVACNTATSAAIMQMRRVLGMTVVSMEPAIKPALERAGDGKIIMLATPATCALSRYQLLKARLDGEKKIIDVGGYGIVERIEQGVFAAGAYQDLLHELLRDYGGWTIDGIVLGCTHYPFIRDEIRVYAERHFAGKCEIFDGGNGTARQLARQLETEGLRSPGPGGKVVFYTSGGEELQPVFAYLLNKAEDTA